MWLLKTINSFVPESSYNPGHDRWNKSFSCYLRGTQMYQNIYMYKICDRQAWHCATVALQKVSTMTERLLKTSKKHNEQIRCACLICSTSLQSLLEPEIYCDGAVILLCVITRISSLWLSFNTYILFTAQNFKRTSTGSPICQFGTQGQVLSTV